MFTLKSPSVFCQIKIDLPLYYLLLQQELWFCPWIAQWFEGSHRRIRDTSQFVRADNRATSTQLRCSCSVVSPALIDEVRALIKSTLRHIYYVVGNIDR